MMEVTPNSPWIFYCFGLFTHIALNLLLWFKLFSGFFLVWKKSRKFNFRIVSCWFLVWKKSCATPLDGFFLVRKKSRNFNFRIVSCWFLVWKKAMRHTTENTVFYKIQSQQWSPNQTNHGLNSEEEITRYQNLTSTKSKSIWPNENLLIPT